MPTSRPHLDSCQVWSKAQHSLSPCSQPLFSRTAIPNRRGALQRGWQASKQVCHPGNLQNSLRGGQEIVSEQGNDKNNCLFLYLWICWYWIIPLIHPFPCPASVRDQYLSGQRKVETPQNPTEGNCTMLEVQGIVLSSFRSGYVCKWKHNTQEQLF